jgi:MFS family permease
MESKSRWWIVFASVFGLLVGSGPVMQFTFGTFLGPVSREFGWSRGFVSSAIVIGLWMTGAATPFVGRLVDRFGIRAVALPGILVFSLSIAAVALVPPSRLAFTLLYALMGLGAAGQTPLVYAKAISARFDAQRGLALGISMAGVGLGATLVPQFVQALITSFGWRVAYVGLGILTFAFAFPAVAIFVGRQLPVRVATRTTAAFELPGLTASESLRTSRFWMLAAGFFLVAGATGGVMSHLVPLLTDRGTSAQTATSLVSIGGIAMIGGRVFSGFLLDRIFAPFVAAVFFSAPLAGILTLLLTSGPVAAAVGTVLIGIGLGAEVDLIAFLLSRYLGMRSFGEIYGYFFGIFMLGAGLGPFAMGVCFDRTGSYQLMLICFACALMIATLLMLRLGAYVYPGKPKLEADSGIQNPIQQQAH